MTSPPPFDPRPRPTEVDDVLRRVHRRRAVRAGGSGAALVAGVVAVALTFSGTANQVLLQDEKPLLPAGQPTPSREATPSAAPQGRPMPSAAAAPSGAPATAGPSPISSPLAALPDGRTPASRPEGQAAPRPSPAPERQQPAYAGQIGPGYGQFQATDCVVTNRSTNDGVVRNGYCIYLVGAGSKSVWRPYIRICRLYDSTSPGRLTFPSGEEADFALYRGRQGADGAPVAEKLLFRFSDTVRYTQGAHGRDVSQGDCWTWRLNLPIDFEAYPANAGFVGEWRSRAEQIPLRDRAKRVHFTAGAFHGDNAP